MKAADVMRNLGITPRQLDYWLRRMGVPGPGSGQQREISDEVATDLAKLIKARRQYQAIAERVLSRYSGGLPSEEAAYIKRAEALHEGQTT